MKKYISLAIIAFLGGCSNSNETEPSPSTKSSEYTPIPISNLISGDYECVSISTNKGEIIVGLNKIKAPESVSNFLGYTNNKHYDDTIFHRVIDGFMIQGGGYDSNFEKKETNSPIVNEADNGLLNNRGAISVARTSSPHSGTAQFFINSVDNNFLDHTSKTLSGWGYTVFGQVVKGINVVDSISKVETGSGGGFSKDVPRVKVVMEEVKVITCDSIEY